MTVNNLFQRWQSRMEKGVRKPRAPKDRLLLARIQGTTAKIKRSPDRQKILNILEIFAL